MPDGDRVSSSSSKELWDEAEESLWKIVHNIEKSATRDERQLHVQGFKEQFWHYLHHRRVAYATQIFNGIAEMIAMHICEDVAWEMIKDAACKLEKESDKIAMVIACIEPMCEEPIYPEHMDQLLPLLFSPQTSWLVFWGFENEFFPKNLLEQYYAFRKRNELTATPSTAFPIDDLLEFMCAESRTESDDPGEFGPPM